MSRVRRTVRNVIVSLVCAAGIGTLLGIASARADADASALGRRFQRPAIRFDDRGSQGLWGVDAPVTLRWRQRRLDGATLYAEVSRDGGATWKSIGSAPAAGGRLTFTATGHWGPAQVRLRTADGAIASRSRRVLFVARIVSGCHTSAASLLLHEDGRVRIFGSVGTSSTLRDPVLGRKPRFRRPTVLDLPGFNHVATLSSASAAAIVTCQDGTAWLWGAPFGRWGLRPRQIPGITRAIWARTGDYGSFVATSDGRVYGFGENPYAFYPEGSDGTERVEEIPSLRGVTDLKLGSEHGLALRPDGTVLSFGSNHFGQLGDPSLPGRFEPGPVPGLSDVVAIGAWHNSSVALRADGSVWVWGTAVGVAREEPFGGLRTPRQVEGLEHIVAITGAGVTALALRDDGAVFGWGWSDSGQLGEDKAEPLREYPVGRCALPPVEKLFYAWSLYAITPTGERIRWGPLPLRDRHGEGAYVRPVPYLSR